MINFKKQLNLQQYRAVSAPDGPLLILAGAGSGKTRALIYRAAFLIQQKNTDPGQILLLTFTNKAATEMQKRLKTLIGVKLPFAGTFHRFCAKFLRTQGKHVGIDPNYLIYDAQDQIDLIKQVMNQQKISTKEFRPQTFQAQISNAKNELITAKKYQTIANGYFQEKVAQVYHGYQAKLRDNHALDFDDLLLETLKVLKSSPNVLSSYQNRFKHILVDEYQDTNKAQYTIIKLLALSHQNITAVGDASQSIYAWRGADYRNLEYLQTDFPNLKIIKLEQNYRSTQTILDAAHSVISNNKTHPILSLWTDKDQGNKIAIFEAHDEQQEAQYILNHLQTQLSDNHQTAAVLYRTNAQSRALEEACIRSGFAYTLVGGTKFYERKEIKDILAYLRLLINPNDTVSLGRTAKLGKRRLQNFLTIISKLNINTTTSFELFDQVLQATDYMDRFNPKNQDDQSRIENIKELKSVASQFEHLTDFLENVALVENNRLADLGNQQPDNPLTLMTMHTSKGLEFDQVFVVGLEEGIFPHSRSLLESKELEEERRLCYVAITRARKHLHLTYARKRLYFGGRQSNTISRFVSEIPEHLLKPINPYSQSSKHTPSSQKSLDLDLLDQFLDDEIDIDQLLT